MHWKHSITFEFWEKYNFMQRFQLSFYFLKRFVFKIKCLLAEVRRWCNLILFLLNGFRYNARAQNKKPSHAIQRNLLTLSFPNYSPIFCRYLSALNTETKELRNFELVTWTGLPLTCKNSEIGKGKIETEKKRDRTSFKLVKRNYIRSVLRRRRAKYFLDGQNNK